MTTIDALEAAAFNAWPAFRQVLLQGWLLRSAGGYTKRANSASFLYPAVGFDAVQLIAQSEQHFAALGLPAVFRIVERPETQQIDQGLARRGYRQCDLSLVLTCPAERLLAVAHDAPPLALLPLEQWLAVFCQLAGRNLATQSNHRRILAEIVPPHLAGALPAADGFAACGLAVLDHGLCGLFDIVTDPAQRQRGHGSRLVAGLANWGASAGATTIYLQVVTENLPARRLYERLGFCEAYRYWYRVA